MKQVLQNLQSGENFLVEAPAPRTREGHLTIATRQTLISAGTERMLLNFGKASYLQKAKQQPEKVKQVIDKIKTDGLATTYAAVKSKLSEPIPLGYCNVGEVVSVGKGCEAFTVGDRVVSNGAHADVVRVAKNLCARVPDEVSDDAAAFTVLASIALQGIRLMKPSLGESVVVIGTGLIGLLAVQLLRANGCRVLAIDFDDKKLALAEKMGAQTCNPAKGEDPVQVGMAFSRAQGVDGVLITASTSSSDPVSQAAQMSRKRGRIILVGVTGLELNRAEFYEKELSFQVSCSYGPGRYDPQYEEAGQDYPLGFVRWTQQRNFEAVLDMMQMGQLDVSSLISHRFLFENAADAYQTLSEVSDSLGIMLEYPQEEIESRLTRSVTLIDNPGLDADKPVVGVIGAGNYASRMLIPALKRAGAQLKGLASSGGISGVVQGKKHSFAQTTTDTDALIDDAQINTVAIATRHDSHADLVCKTLAKGKHVFVEKPLVINEDQLLQVEKAYDAAKSDGKKPVVMVGFNRRFAPHVVKMKSLLTSMQGAKSFVFTVNAGAIPTSHWTQDADVGGGRIIGEACHFIDLMRFLAGTEIINLSATSIKRGSNAVEDIATITLSFADGSFGTIHYFANGANSFPKERLEVFCNQTVLQLDNFRKLVGYGVKGFSKMTTLRQDKGHNACSAAFIEAIAQGKASPISADELFEVARWSIEASKQIRG